MKLEKILLVSLLCMFFSCRNKFTYYLKETNFTFCVEEKDTEDVIIFGKGDSVFFKSLHGQYCCQNFHVCDSSKTIYLDDFDYYRIVHKNYNFVVMEFMKDGENLPTVRLPKNCYDFYGSCDQGRYTFFVFKDSTKLRYLEPLEWK